MEKILQKIKDKKFKEKIEKMYKELDETKELQKNMIVLTKEEQSLLKTIINCDDKQLEVLTRFY